MLRDHSPPPRAPSPVRLPGGAAQGAPAPGCRRPAASSAVSGASSTARTPYQPSVSSTCAGSPGCTGPWPRQRPRPWPWPGRAPGAAALPARSPGAWGCAPARTPTVGLGPSLSAPVRSAPRVQRLQAHGVTDWQTTDKLSDDQKVSAGTPAESETESVTNAASDSYAGHRMEPPHRAAPGLERLTEMYRPPL